MADRAILVNPDTFNEAFLPFLYDDTPNQILYGGAGSGKSMFIARRTVLDIVRRERNYLIARATQRSIRQSTWNEILDAIEHYQLTPYFERDKTGLTITCKVNGCQIVFVGCDNTEKLKSIRPLHGVFTDLWCEEATEISQQSNKQLRIRLRGPVSHGVVKRYIYSFNPIYATHWINQTYFMPNGIPPDVRIWRDDNLVVFRSTYKDNRFLSRQDVDELLSYKDGDPYWYQVYAEGKWGMLGNTVYRDWETADLTEQYRLVDNFSNGLDFGYTNDPSALVRNSRSKDGKALYIYTPEHGQLYSPGYDNTELANEVIRRIGKDIVWCDCSEPKSIAELKREGVSARAVSKGADSVLHGIQWLQKHHIVVDINSQGVINELSTYCWLKDKMGNPYNKPQDANNHALDALRYSREREMRAKRPMLVVSEQSYKSVQQRRPMVA